MFQALYSGAGVPQDTADKKPMRSDFFKEGVKISSLMIDPLYRFWIEFIFEREKRKQKRNLFLRNEYYF